MWGHVLWSLSAFHSQLSALIVAVFCSPLNPEAMQDYNSKDPAVQVPPADEAGWAARSASAEPQCWSSRSGSASCQSFCTWTLSATHICKNPGAVPRNPLDLVAIDAQRFEKQSLTSFCRLPYQGMESRQYGCRRLILELNMWGLQRTQATEMIQYVEHRNTYTL